MATCQDCGGCNFVIVYREGDEVCRDCGLVRSSHLLAVDETYTSYEVYNDTPDSPVGAKYDAIDNIMDKLGLENVKIINTVARSLLDTAKSKHHFRDNKLFIVSACCVYIACQTADKERLNRSSQEITSRLGIDTTTFSKTVKHIQLLTKSATANVATEDDSLIRQIQQVHDVPMKMLYRVANWIRDKDRRRRDLGLLLGTSPMITNAVLIYACLLDFKIKVSKSSICKYGWVSRATLDKHLKTLKHIL